jgi:ABC-type bacteriocin/lantibiotic exporter with double-glycine peptidase domain
MLNVPDVRQRQSHDCGPAVVKSIERFHGRRNIPLRLYVAALSSSPTDGTDPRTMERLLRQYGYEVISGEMAVRDLKHFTGKGWPVIVCGIARGKVHIQDPFDGPRPIKVNDFERQWKDHDRIETFKQWGIVAWC